MPRVSSRIAKHNCYNCEKPIRLSKGLWFTEKIHREFGRISAGKCKHSDGIYRPHIPIEKGIFRIPLYVTQY